ncbi:MAG: CehA/McbA family metallohydrolase, partial [Lachnospiraceae bacterium]|nr:CehA/McbA family metallohydrolase [Lachnospiraceae bacterium]
PVAEGTGKVRVTVTESSGPVLCEVRFFEETKESPLVSEYVPSGRIGLIRKITGEDGVLETDIPAGFYLVKVSKGSEYSREYRHIEVKSGESLEVSFELQRLMDLPGEGFFAGDIHHHSIYSSPVWGGTDDVIESAKEVADSMRAMGLTYGALSDHHNIFNHKDWKACETGDFLPIPSKEISTSNGHVLSLGVDEYDVIYKIPEAKDRTEDYLRKEFVRITDEIREKGGLPQLNHPRDLQISISWNRDFYDMTEIFETVEIWNGSNPMYFGSTDALAAEFWRDLLEEGRYIPATTGSDTHNTRADDYHVMYAEAKWLFDRLGHRPEASIAKLSEYSRELNAFRFICGRFLPMLEVWAKTSLTSGCVRTYVKLPAGERPGRSNVLSALRSGHSFLTNGPVLTISVNGKSMGETAEVKDGKAKIKISLRSNRPLEKILLYTGKKRETVLTLPKKEQAPLYVYDCDITDMDLSETGYVFAVAKGMEEEVPITNLAITNPVLIKHI